ncbi:SchA/CurD-like domain-containing protein [Streptomyces sp. SPB162]|uniref:SchA/CurD-like domain-containing protein n=1 Tax=Streptomyces sp. SPB162 TaxID=2940560 RepID=UPI0024076FFC|nr:SchA/CurD-like domain-containing protein [Streptomyces sp. SPB162]MDF9811512.1 heme-degrading monooxygenase HmoA [Streptomyces sp. SPB162]
MTTLDDRRIPDATLETTRLRVVLLLDVLEGREDRFLEAYEEIRHQVAGVPGHVSDQLCQSLGNSSQWLITSEWESSEPFLAWVESAAHREMVEPLHGCVRDTTSLRFVIARETPDPLAPPRPERHVVHPERPAARTRPAKAAGTPRAAKPAGTPRAAAHDPLPAPPLCSGGIVRHAITFTVKPGSEPAVAEILAGYRSPQARVDATTQLRRTSLFLHGNRVVRAVEVTGDLGNALRHVAAQPEVRAVEEAINPYLEEARDLTDGASARAFFARAALPAVGHVAGPAETGQDDGVTRRAYFYPVKAGRGEAAARLLAELDAAAAADPTRRLVGSTVFHRDDVLVRVVDLAEPRGKAPARERAEAMPAELKKLLDLGKRHDPSGAAELSYGVPAMDLITDRRSQAV